MRPYVHGYLRLSMRMYMLMHQQQMQRSTQPTMLCFASEQASE